MTVRILIADNHTLIRRALARLLGRHQEVEVVGVAADGEAAIELAVELQPDVVLMDVSMPSVDGIEATRRIIAQQPEVKVLALSAHLDEPYVSGMLTAGATGYVLKTITPEQLLEAIERVAAGGTYLDPDVTDVVVADYAHRHAPASELSRPSLTGRERDVLGMLAAGQNTRQIAAKLGLSIKTVETYRGRIMDKLELRTVAELTKYAIREGLTSLEP